MQVDAARPKEPCYIFEILYLDKFKMYFYRILYNWILLFGAVCGIAPGKAQPLDPSVFYALSTPQARMAFLRKEFSPTDKAAYQQLLPNIEAQKDRVSTLFWHYRYYVLADSFGLSIDEQTHQLHLMRAKATRNGDRIATLVADANLLILQHKQEQINVIQLYKKSVLYIEEMRKIGFNNFVNYDLNAIISYCMADLSTYWGSEPENIRKYSKISEKYVSPSALSQHYQNIVYYQLRDCDLQDRNMEGCNNYSWKIYQLNHDLNPTMNPAEWRTAYWQVIAMSQLAILHHIEKQYTEASTYAKKAVNMYKNLKIIGYENKKAEVEKYILDDLIIVLICLSELKEVPPLLARFDSILVKLRQNGHASEYSEWGLWRDREQFYEKTGDFKHALEARRIADNYFLAIFNRNSKHELERVREEHQVETYVDQLQTVNAQRRMQQYITLAVVGLMLLLSAVAYAVYRRINRDKKLITSQKAILEEALVEKETLIKEIHHRVKNNLQIISGLLEKQASKISDETTKKLLKEGQNRVFSMALVHQNLYQSDNLSAVDIQQYFSLLVSNIQKTQQIQDKYIKINLSIMKAGMTVDMAIPLGLILNELLTNCYKYAFAGRDAGAIEISFQPNADGGYAFAVQDNGNGIAPELDWRKSRSLGLNLVSGLVRQLGGQIEVVSAPETGTLVRMRIPTGA